MNCKVFRHGFREAGAPDTRVFCVLGWEAGGFCVLGWEAEGSAPLRHRAIQNCLEDRLPPKNSNL